MEKQAKEVTISIVTHNSEKIFLSLDALIKSLGETSTVSIRIFDNASEKDYQDKLRYYLNFPFIQITFFEENKGFGFGHNYNLLPKPTPYAIIFNPDIILEQNLIMGLVGLLKEHPDCALLAPKILNEDGTTQYLIRNKLDVFDYILRFIPFKPVKRLFKKRLSQFECRGLSDTKDSYVRMISGSFMVVDLARFSEVDGFDERFFMYFEDNDLCRKIEAAGYKALYTPRYEVVHLYERGAVKSKKLFLIFLQSMAKYFNKWGWQFF
ncbi:glycosyl transferase family 2 [Enterococcus florum]|uniref:Glycosyl transferase family 2 n=1 Tax=Enterococcus florum TaxID=2480627 RepID=A0A4P5PD47_9ENTE|nr:glycosyltransferase family 2 protein [Enterococcus florum]GCF93938.1 glycosyl transferase family 2 [Enterococcus florum]